MMTDISGIGDSAIQSNYLIVQATGFLLIVQCFVTTLSGTLVSTPIGVYAPRIPYSGVRLKPFHASSLLTPPACSANLHFRTLPELRRSDLHIGKPHRFIEPGRVGGRIFRAAIHQRSEEHTSELQSRGHLV